MARSEAGAPELAGGVEPADWPAVTLPGLLEIWASLREAADRVENNVNPRLAIEVFLADVRRAPAA
jgi:hypothetical protein